MRPSNNVGLQPPQGQSLQNQQNPPFHNVVLETLSELSSHDNIKNLPHEVEVISRLRVTSPPPSSYVQSQPFIHQTTTKVN